MAESIIDFGQIAQTGIALGNLEETRRRNDIYEQNALTELGRLQVDREQRELQRQKLRFDTTAKAFDEIEKLSKSPQYASNPLAQVDLRFTQANLLKHGLGINIPVPSREEMIGSMEQFGSFLRAVRSGDPEQRRTATDALMMSAPEFGGKVLDELKKANELDAQGEQLRTKIEIDKTRLQAMNQKVGQVKLQQGVYTEHLGALGGTIGMVEDPRFKEHFYKLKGMKNEESKQAYLKIHPEFAEAWNAELSKRTLPLAMTVLKLGEDVRARQAAVKEQQKANGIAPDALLDELSGYGVVQKARQLEAAWAEDPFNPQKWDALRKAEQSVRILYGTTEKQLTGIEQDRLNFMKSKVEDVKQSKLAENYASERFLEYLKTYKDNDAALLATRDTGKQFPGVPWDTGVFKNLEKVGKQEVAIKMGSEDVSRNLKQIEASQGVIDFASELRDKIKENPAIVGPGAQLGAAFAGSVQQLRSIARMDPTGSKFLNTKTRDQAEALHEILVYLEAKTLDPTGALDLKVVENARKVIGDLSSFTTGPQQILNKLELVTTTAQKRIRQSRRRLKGGIDAYLTDEVDPDKPVGEMTEQELMQRILQGVSQ